MFSTIDKSLPGMFFIGEYKKNPLRRFMLIFLARRFVGTSALVFLIEEMKEKAEGGQGSVCIQLGKIYLQESYGISKLFLLTLPYSLLLTPRKRKKKDLESFAGLLSGLFKYPLESPPVK